MTISTSVHGEWSAGARSVAEFSGDCLFSFSVPASVSGIAIGLNSLNASSQPEEIQHGFLCTGSAYYVVESGIRRTAPATIGTSFSIRREAGVVTNIHAHAPQQSPHAPTHLSIQRHQCDLAQTLLTPTQHLPHDGLRFVL